MKRRVAGNVGAGLLLALAVVAAHAATIGLDAATEYQTIEGFGANGGLNTYFEDGPWVTDEFADDVINDLGLTLHRHLFVPDEWNRWYKMPPVVRAFAEKARQAGEPYRYFGTVASAPPHMKDNGSIVGGGHVLPEHYDDFAQWIVGKVRLFHQETGVEMYALSFSNEPRFTHDFESGLWTEQEYVDFLKVLGQKFAAEGLSTKIIGPEDMLTLFGAYAGFINQDPEAKQYLHALAVHGYVDGFNPASGIVHWKRLSSATTALGCQGWQSEISGYTNDWPSTFGYVQNMHNALKYGKVSGWVWWCLSGRGGEDGTFGLMFNQGSKGKKYYASKNFYRYIRPDAVMIGCDDSADEDIDVVAFNHKNNRTLTVVALNKGGSTKEITLSGDAPTSFDVYRTSASEDCQHHGAVSGGSSVSLPPSSVTTLFAQEYTVSTPAAMAARHTPVHRSLAAGTKVFGLDGRSMNGRCMRAMPGVCIVETAPTGAASCRLVMPGQQQ
ncbi:MAG: hypothetical protein GF331_22330 [Chitinivibrionales bacterium]|nr:hypothetical protein [Chitinivibrionales bacterium]